MHTYLPRLVKLHLCITKSTNESAVCREFQTYGYSRKGFERSANIGKLSFRHEKIRKTYTKFIKQIIRKNVKGKD